jgi:hypothetical protein
MCYASLNAPASKNVEPLHYYYDTFPCVLCLVFETTCTMRIRVQAGSAEPVRYRGNAHEHEGIRLIMPPVSIAHIHINVKYIL